MSVIDGVKVKRNKLQFSRLTNLDGHYVREKIESFLQEDDSEGDITTNYSVDTSMKMEAILIAEEECVVAGSSILPHCFPKDIIIQSFIRDGGIGKANEVLAKICGSARTILKRERVVLNLLQRLCGIATKTRQYVKRTQNYNFKVLDTRKMTPGLRMFEKFAVALGGGFNHRLDLSTAVLIKDNHIISAGGLELAVKNIQDLNPEIPIELEVDTLRQLEQGLDMNVDGFLLDNMSPDLVKKSLKIVNEHPNGTDVFVEASGGIQLDTIGAYAETGVHAASIGSLTTKVQNIDLKLEMSPV
jgi:nicotinate-nucleotide pyrophosphorylase (carboxylating)